MKKLRDVKRPDSLLTVQMDATVTEAIWVMAAHEVGMVVVLEGDRPAGILSDRDVLRRVLDRDLDPARIRVGEVMTGCMVAAGGERLKRGARRSDAPGARGSRGGDA